MSPRSFAILAAAAAVSVVLAVAAVLSRDLPATTAAAGEEPLFPGLLDRVNEVRTVRITAPGKTLTAQAGEKGWMLAEKGGYPVEPRELREMVLGVANLKLVEAKTADQARLKRLELEDPSAEAAKSRQVELLGEGGDPIAAVVVGKGKPGLYGGGRGGVYVRRAGEPQSWLAAGELDVPGDALDLVDQTVIDIPAEQVARITLQPAGGAAPIRLHRPDAAAETFAVDAALPEGRALDPGSVDQVAGALSGLTLQDVKPAAELAVPADAPRSRFETFDGVAVEATVATLGEGDAAERWVLLEASTVEPAAADPAASAAKLNDPAGSAAQGKTPEGRAAELNSRTRGWAFKIAPYLADRLAGAGGLDALLAEKGQGAS
ncbi:MAG TPA: DUF4340 domain-containing protein [Geminicoccaceae bacterium]|nr:DUF4340 domain-containing protein [Geminicoccaceae bacterium]